MLVVPLVAVLSLLAPAEAETVLGVAVFSRHGDRRFLPLLCDIES